MADTAPIVWRFRAACGYGPKERKQRGDDDGAVADWLSRIGRCSRFGHPRFSDRAGTAAVTIVATLVFASILGLCSCADVFGASVRAFLSELSDEDQHRRGAFRRQYAPGTPGRPGWPRAPGRHLVGLAR